MIKWRQTIAAVCSALMCSTLLFGCNGGEKEVSEAGSGVSGETSTSETGAGPEENEPLEPDKYSPKTEVTDAVYDTGLCVTEWQTNYKLSPVDLKKRFALYQECGFKTIRVETYWSSFMPRAGEVVNPSQQLYLYTAKEAGFRFKMILGTVMGVPGWYFEEHPGAKMKDQNGREAVSSVSYFAPNLREHLTEVLDTMMAYMQETGFLDSIDTLVVDCGQAGEGIYPPAWTQTPNGLDTPSGPDVFWGYDDYSQQNFRQTVQAKYGTIAAANAAWGKNYSSFDEVEVPKPGGPGGGIWEDYLYWYRDSKRNFIEEQIKMYKAAAEKYSNGRIKLILYLPGFDTRDADWEAALKNGDGNGSVRIMADNRYLIELAKEYGCWLQFTGFENSGETKYLREYMDANGAGDIPFFGENSGGYDAVKNASSAFNTIRRNGLAGVDITHSRWLYEENGITPCKSIDNFKKNMRVMQNYLRAGSAN